MADSTITNPTPQEGLQTEFMKSIQGKLLDQSGIVSSTNSQLEQRLNAAISGVKTSAEKSNQALELDYGRQIGYTADQGMQSLNAGRAAGSGGILNMAAYTALRDETNKNLKDLEDRKQSLILQNDAAAAAKVGELQFQALDFQQKAQQQTFSNLLGMANLGIQTQQEARLAQQQSFQEQQATTNIALQYGLTVKPGETLADVATRAMPIASKEQQARLAKIVSDTRLNNAQAVKALQGDANGVTDSSLPTLVNQAILFDSAGKNPVTDVEYSNLIGTITKAGKLPEYYKIKQQTSLAKIEAEKKAVEASQKPAVNSTAGIAYNPKSGKVENYTINGLTGEKKFTGSSSDLKIDFSTFGKNK